MFPQNPVPSQFIRTLFVLLVFAASLQQVRAQQLQGLAAFQLPKPQPQAETADAGFGRPQDHTDI